MGTTTPTPPEVAVTRHAVLALALALAGFGHVPTAGADPVPGPDGQRCFLLSATDLGPEPPPDTQVGVLVAGPLNGTGTLTCSIQLGAAGTHAGANWVTVTATDDVVPGRILDAELVSYPLPPNTAVYVCAQYTEGSSTIYWNGTSWDDDVNSPCEQPVVVRADDPLTGDVIGAATGLGSLAVCPALQFLAPSFSDPAGLLYIHPSGDAFLSGRAIWDCASLDQRTLVEQVAVVVGPLP